MTDKNKKESAPVKKATTKKKQAAKKMQPKSAAAIEKVEASKGSDVKSAAAIEKVSASKESDIKSDPAIEKARASKDSDMKAAAKKISDLDKKAADDAIRSKQSSEELKQRAHEAKRRAQEKILEKSFVSDPPVDPLERLANTFDSSSRRWEMVVYPSLFAFVLLAGYGFFLIYRLTHDIHSLSQSVTKMAVIVSDAMPRMNRDLSTMTSSMDNMTGNIAGMSTEISSMSGQMDELTPMSNNIQSMTHNIGSMNRSVYGMQRDMHGMNRTVSSGPFGMMNDMMPFSSNSNVPPPLMPPRVWPSYNSTVPQPQAYSPRTAPQKSVSPAESTESITTEIIMPGAAPVTLKEVVIDKDSSK